MQLLKEFKLKLQDAKSIRENFLQERADYHSVHMNISSSIIIKRIIQAEKNK